MSPLPFSLSPHICVLPSPDLTELFASSALPPLPHILQSFSPLPQVTTRTTSLVSVPHTSFALRFSDLAEIEVACQEEEEERAVRTIDWVGARINKRCSKWVEDIEKIGDKGAPRTPWWDELRRCAEGDLVPSKSEGWNHPVAVIFAVSTTAPNPLQAITALHSRNVEFPAWVDPNFLQYTLIVHPHNSPLSDEEAGALFNAVKKQFGLHSYLLPLALPQPPPSAVPVPALMPRLPPHPSLKSSSSTSMASPDLPTHPNSLNTLRMAEIDIQQTARFTREFVVMSLLPWMEKCVVEWNENFSSTRRLPSRLFSSTRRLFGSPSPSPSPAHHPSSSVSSLPSRMGSHVPGSVISPLSPPSQQQRLAEFASMLGDIKLATQVWEAIRKEGKSGSDILPLLLSPSPTLQLHVMNAISHPYTQIPDPPAHAQLRSLKYAVRWEGGIANSDFISNTLEGERWLVWAAGNAEETPAALLLAHAALLSSLKKKKKRAALWYLIAANRLEKCGIKPLTMYFLRRAHELYKDRPQKEVSPLFWEAEGKPPMDIQGIDAIMSGIEHPLGRLLYTTGNVGSAVQLFMGLLRGSSQTSSSIFPSSLHGGASNNASKIPGTDKVYLDDFRVAFSHLKSTSKDGWKLLDLNLPFRFCLERQTCIRFPGSRDERSSGIWQRREDDWKLFLKSRGAKEDLSTKDNALVNDVFWVDLVLQNPLDTEVNLSNVTILVQTSNTGPSQEDFLEVGIIDDVVLSAKELHTVPIYIKSTRPASLSITHAKYDFLSLLPTKESLATRGRRLHDTPLQRQEPTYSPNIIKKVEVVEAVHKMLVSFVDDEHLTLIQGERRSIGLSLSNSGMRPINDVWIIAGPEDEILLDVDDKSAINTPEISETLFSANSLASAMPLQILSAVHEQSVLNPGDNLKVSITFHADYIGDRDLSLLFVYRENESSPFQSAHLTRTYRVNSLLETSVSAQVSHTLDHSFIVDLGISNISSTTIQVTQVTCLSPNWRCIPISEDVIGSMLPSQSSHIILGANWCNEGSGSRDTLDFVTRKLNDVLQGATVEVSMPPPIHVLCSHLSKAQRTFSINLPRIQEFINLGKRNTVSRAIAHAHPHIPDESYPLIFPLYNPASVDFVIFWEINAQRKSGHIFVPGVVLGARHAPLRDIIAEAESTKVKRSMYAETRREKLEILDAVRESEWNAETDPVVLSVQETNVVSHDFDQGPCCTPITIILRNHSSTYASRFMLRFTVHTFLKQISRRYLVPFHVGPLSFRGTLEPLQVYTVHPQLWITIPGTYGLGGWSLETEVLEGPPGRAVRHRYRQEVPLVKDGSCLIVSSIQSL
ncbi:ER-golgi trafficking TRAPP I complex 85 kDa subunit-domain-containing protein [Collybia nuda]|uniref:ER-golgi trafficking TRAPP I complex 85 kDa subunit-domain-containing protein n=1 Tax=Collybia nuda TaxID=64659 RepID=A0A9P6CHB0_9AGAR|nr:ER-golgi trafficking TRAPP I complex 85 kDa subunit-domain-containing protein [Collybia nuda]